MLGVLSTSRNFQEIFDMKNVWVREVPRNLIPDHTRTRLQISPSLFHEVQGEATAFFGHIVTKGKAWVHDTDPESKERSSGKPQVP